MSVPGNNYADYYHLRFVDEDIEAQRGSQTRLQKQAAAGLALEPRGSDSVPQLPSLGTRRHYPSPTSSLGTESWLPSKTQGPWSPGPASPSPIPRTKYTCRGNIPAH